MRNRCKRHCAFDALRSVLNVFERLTKRPPTLLPLSHLHGLAPNMFRCGCVLSRNATAIHFWFWF